MGVGDVPSLEQAHNAKSAAAFAAAAAQFEIFMLSFYAYRDFGEIHRDFCGYCLCGFFVGF